MSALSLIAFGKAIAAPATLGVLLVAMLWRSANGWRVLAAWLCGVWGAFELNNFCLRNLPSMLPDGQIHAQTWSEAWLSGFAEAAIPEELSKGVLIFLLLGLWQAAAVRHGALIGGLVALGFALSENLHYAQVSPEWRVMAVISHCAWGVILGRLLELALFETSRRWLAVVWAFVAVIVLHGLVDSGIFMVDAFEYQVATTQAAAEAGEDFSPSLVLWMATTFAVDILSIVWAVRTVRQVRRLPE